MAAKKTAKKATETTPKDAASAPVAKKAAKKAAKKTAAPKAEKSPETKAAKPVPAAKAPVKPATDAVARAAYLNYRRRVEQGLPGDSHGDWLEAERQLGKA